MTTKIRLTLQPTPNNDPGAGILIISKAWEGAQENLRLTIQRNDALYLQDAKHNASPWASSACNFALSNLEVVSDRLQAYVGANLIDPLVNSARTSPVHQIELHDQHGHSATGSLIIKQAPLPSIAGGSSSMPEQNAVVDTPDISVSAAKPEADAPPAAKIEPPVVVGPPQPITAAPGKKTRIAVLLLLLGLAVAAAIGGWLWFKSKDSVAIPASATPATQASADQAPVAAQAESLSACDPSQMANQSDLEFIQRCLKDEPDSASLLATIQQAKSNNHCSIAQRLYANRSQAGDLQIAAAYVKEYDPKYHQPSECFTEPNEATARYWYETILQKDPDNAEAKLRLTELGQ